MKFDNKNSSWTEKYELLKIYYKFQNVQLLFNDKQGKESNILFNIFKKDKNNKKSIFTGKKLLKEYQNYFKELIDETVTKDEKNETSLELIKAIFIMLIYEQNILFELNVLNDNKESLSSNILINGVKNSLSKEGLSHHVSFKLRHIPNYFKIQLSIIGSTLFFK